MSYILEALRRADAQRALGQSPGLHAQSPAVPAAADDAAGPPRRTRWALGATGIAVLVAFAVWAGWRAALPPAPAPASEAAPAAVVPAAPAPSAPVAAAPVEPAVTAAAAAPSRTPPLASLPPLPPPAVTAPPAPPPANAAAPSADAAGAVMALSELPPAQRALLPPLVVGGAVDSPQPSARLLVLDGRVLREGETIARDLVLERIGPRQAVLRWREQRVCIDF